MPHEFLARQFLPLRAAATEREEARRDPLSAAGAAIRGRKVTWYTRGLCTATWAIPRINAVIFVGIGAAFQRLLSEPKPPNGHRMVAPLKAPSMFTTHHNAQNKHRSGVLQKGVRDGWSTGHVRMYEFDDARDGIDDVLSIGD